MAITLSNAQQLSQSKLTNFVIDEFRKSALLDMLTFDNCVKPQGGTSLAYAYNRVTTLPTAATRAINAEYTAQNAVTTQKVVNLAVMGGSFEIDRVLQLDEWQAVDLCQFHIQQKAQAAVALYHDLFINGNATSDATQFDGLAAALASTATEITPAAAIDLSTSANIDSNWKKFLDNFRKIRSKMDGAPTLYLMNSDMFAVFQSVMDRAGIGAEVKSQYGNECLQWGASTLMAMGDKPGTSNPIIGIDSAAGTTDIYAVRLGLDGVHGVSPEGTKLVQTYLPDFSQPGAVKKGEVELVAAAAVKSTRAAGVLHKIKIA